VAQDDGKFLIGTALRAVGSKKITSMKIRKDLVMPLILNPDPSEDCPRQVFIDNLRSITLSLSLCLLQQLRQEQTQEQTISMLQRQIAKLQDRFNHHIRARAHQEPTDPQYH